MQYNKIELNWCFDSCIGNDEVIATTHLVSSRYSTVRHSLDYNTSICEFMNNTQMNLYHTHCTKSHSM